MITIQTPMDSQIIQRLNAGDEVMISGVIYTARDAAHKKMIELLDNNQPLPFEVKGQIIYYVGPCPAPPGHVIGSAGPTTSGRMDSYAPRLISLGLSGMLGKGLRNQNVINAMVEYGSIYFGAIGGAGAYIAKCILSEEVIAFPELGPEAVRRLTVKNLPAYVVIDAKGRNFYEIGRQKYSDPACE